MNGTRGACVAGALMVLGTVALAGQTLYVSPTGSDQAAGTEAEPLATMRAALTKIGAAGDATVVLMDGTWPDRVRVNTAFEKPVTIRAAHAGKAVIRDCFVFGAKNVAIEGVRFDGQDNPAVANVCQVAKSSFVVLRDCSFTHGVGGHDNSDALKVNDGSNHVLVEGCRIFDGTDEDLDILQPDVHDLVFRNNVLYHDKVRKPEAAASVKMNTYRVVFDGNVFANMNPDASNGALRFGGSEKTDQRPHDLVALNNVFIHNDGRSDLNLGGASRMLIAGNVFFNQKGRGIIEASTNYPAGGNPNDDFFIVNNIFAHTEGNMPTIYAHRNGTVERFTIRNNLYFNGGARVRAKQLGNAFFDPAAETGAQFANPQFVGPLQFSGTPQLAWKAALAVKADSPFRQGRVELDKLDLPDTLKAFLDAYLTGAGDDPWYRQIAPKAERR